MCSAIPGYEDIHQETPYLDADIDGEVAYVDMIYVPPSMRGRGIGVKLVNEWLLNLDLNVKRVKLKAATLGGSDAIAFWERLGFQKAYAGDHLYQEIDSAMVLGVNGYSTPVPEIILQGDEYRHWTECEQDKAHLAAHPQVYLGLVIMEKHNGLMQSEKRINQD